MSGPEISPIRLKDGYEAAARWWLPERPRGAVLYFHGIQSHGGWYERSGQALADAGLAVLMPDRRGSGLNMAQRGHSESAEMCIADAAAAVQALVARTGCKRVHVVGVSWGGKLSVAVADRAGEQVATLSLVAPGLFPRVDLATVDKFRVAFSLIHERDKLYDIPLNLPVMFTENPERLAFVAADPIKLQQVSASFLLATRRLDRFVRGFSHTAWRGGLHLFLAGKDRIIDNDHCRAWFRGLPLADKKLTDYPDAAHTIEFEPDPAFFFSDLTGWIAERVESDGGA